MKNLLTLLSIIAAFQATAVPADVYHKLVELNVCWLEQQDIARLDYPKQTGLDDREWIRVHLSLVEQVLRGRNTQHLSEVQKANRLAALDYLNQYWHNRNFPINDLYNHRTPIFIDRFDNFCAVGYLLKATGQEAVSRKIAAQTNLAYVREMNYPELFAWAEEYGFTVDELAWIQPTYVFYPPETANPVGKGTNGIVCEMHVSQSGNQLFVGGNFTTVDSLIGANNIAYVTDSANVYTWHSMGIGVNGPVYAIQEFENAIFIGGNFNKSGMTPMSSVAYWDGSVWQRAGCIDGTVKDLVVFNNELYACGDLNMCNGQSDVNFVKWTGTGWLAIPGLKGHINRMYVNGNELILGGLFTYNNDSQNIIKWYKQFGFITYQNVITNEVLDICRHRGSLIVSGRSTSTKGELLYRNSGLSSWVGIAPGIGNQSVVSYATLCPDVDTLWVGGDFFTPPLPTCFGSSYVYSYSTRLLYMFNSDIFPYGGFYLDGAVRKFIMFKGTLIGGGEFKDHYYPGTKLLRSHLNGIFHKDRPKPPQSPPNVPPYAKAIPDNKRFVEAGNTTSCLTNVDKLGKQKMNCRIYPNPAHDVLVIENNFSAKEITLCDLGGRSLWRRALNGERHERLILPSLTAGVYIVMLKGSEGQNIVQRLVLQ